MKEKAKTSKEAKEAPAGIARVFPGSRLDTQGCLRAVVVHAASMPDRKARTLLPGIFLAGKLRYTTIQQSSSTG